MTTVPPPPLDPRGRAELAAWTAELAQRYSAWRPAPDGSPDPGSALVGIAARFAELVVRRLNQAPDVAHLAFLDLIGERPTPARPARVPVTFTAAEGTPVGVPVPAGTPLSAPGGDARPEGVTFETDEPLVLSPARLRHVVVVDPVHDTWTDASPAPDGGLGAEFAAFAGGVPVLHRMHIEHSMFGTEPASALTVMTWTPPDEPWPADALSWSRWDGTAWTPLTPEISVRTESGHRAVRETFRSPPASLETEVEGIKGNWLRADLTVPLTGLGVAEPPTSVAVGRRPPEAFSPGLAPFGDGQVKWFYLSLPHPPDRAAGTRIRITFSAARWGRPVRGRPAVLNWSYRVADAWKLLGRASSDGSDPQGELHFADTTAALTRAGEGGSVSFDLPSDLAGTLLNGVDGFWLRAESDTDAGGGYDVAPLVDAIEVAYDRPRARLQTIVMERAAANRTPVPVASAYANGAELDLTRSILPFGDQPGYEDTLYLECPEQIAIGGLITLSVTVTNADVVGAPEPKVKLKPALRWETFDGTGWRPVSSVSRADPFTTSGDVTILPVTPPKRSELAGVTAYWVRVVLLGSYGKPAGYTIAKNDKNEWITSYTEATLAPPLLGSLAWRPTAVYRDLPKTIVSRNGEQVRVDVRPDSHDLTDLTTEGGPGLVPFVAAGESDPALHLGFDRDLGREPVTLFLPVEPLRPEEVAGEGGDARPRRLSVVWEYSAPGGWRPLVVVDGSGGFGDRGTVRFVGPPDQAPRAVAGREGYWLRARVAGGDLPFSPRLRAVLPDTEWATEGVTVAEEILGAGGVPGLGLVTAHAPVLPGQRLLVREPGAGETADDDWAEWEQVDDLRSSGPDDQHYTLDRRTGAIRFGDGFAGRVPPPGGGGIRIGYRYGGGAAGNAAAGTVATLAVALPSVDAVVNHLPAEGGADLESLEDLRARGSRSLRHRGRAVTAGDLEDLALLATREVARARAVPPRGYDPFDLWLDPAAPVPTEAHEELRGGRAGVVIVPATSGDRPSPSPGLLQEVRTYLLDRGPATADVWVSGPEWISVGVVATVVPVPGVELDTLRRAIRDRLRGFLHPITGGTSGRGWDFGRKPHRSDLFALVQAVPGIDHVRQLTVHATPEATPELFVTRILEVLDRPLAAGAAARPDAEARRWLDRSLVYSGEHEITMTLRG